MRRIETAYADCIALYSTESSRPKPALKARSAPLVSHESNFFDVNQTSPE